MHGGVDPQGCALPGHRTGRVRKDRHEQGGAGGRAPQPDGQTPVRHRGGSEETHPRQEDSGAHEVGRFLRPEDQEHREDGVTSPQGNDRGHLQGEEARVQRRGDSAVLRHFGERCAQEKSCDHVQDGRHLRGRVPGGDALLLLDLRQRVRAELAQEGQGPRDRERAHKDRAGDRVRHLLRAGHNGAEGRGDHGGDNEQQPGDRLNGL